MNKNKIINIVIYSLIGLGVVVGICLLISFLNKKENVYKEEIYNFLNQGNSSIYGLMNYDFENIDHIVSTDVLTNAKFMENSILSEEDVNKLYISLYGVSKDKYISASNYIENPVQNCYYHQNVLKENGYNCNRICSLSTSEIMNEMKNKFEWDNILPEDAKIYCISDAKYSIEGSGYFVDLDALNSLYSSITNKDLSYNVDIAGNELYKYGVYLSNSISTLNRYIVNIDKIKNVKNRKNKYTVSYEAKLNDESIEKGKVILEKVDDKYYIVSNELGIGYSF